MHLQQFQEWKFQNFSVGFPPQPPRFRFASPPPKKKTFCPATVYGTVNTYSRTINLPNVISIRVHALWTLPIDPNSEDNIA